MGTNGSVADGISATLLVLWNVGYLMYDTVLLCSITTKILISLFIIRSTWKFDLG